MPRASARRHGVAARWISSSTASSSSAITIAMTPAMMIVVGKLRLPLP